MAVTRVNGLWLADVQPGGRGGPRIRKKFRTRREAERFVAFTRSEEEQGKPWVPRRVKKRRLSALIDEWYELHGINLKDGDRRKAKLLAVAKALRNPLASSVTPAMFIAYRNSRVANGISPTTVNRELSYLKAVYNEVERAGEGVGNPVAKVKPIKQDERELSYLTHGQIDMLFAELARSSNKDALLVAKISLATGARWSEAEKLKASDVHRDRIVYAGTKSGKIRVVPIAPDLAAELLAVKKPWRLFNSCYWAFRAAMKRTGIDLPRGQMAHVLRHTFASHFVMNGGNILVLQKILGHSDLRLTMRYAHLSPEHLEEAAKLNPLAFRP